MYNISVLDFILTPIYIIVLMIFARNVTEKNIATNPAYKYYQNGLYFKFFGAFGLCMIYLFYYKDQGDTTNYMYDASILLNIASRDFNSFTDILFNGLTAKSYSVFNMNTGFPAYFWNKKIEWVVTRFTTPFALAGLKLYIPTSIVLAYVSYLGNWRLYLVFVDTFPKIYEKLAIPLLFIPSCVFWGAGILKDTYTYSAMGWFVYGFYFAFIKRQNYGRNILSIILASWIIISIKPYIFIALLPGALIWLNFDRLKNIKSTFVRVLVTPLLFVVLGGGGVFIMSQLGTKLDKYSSVDKALETAVVTQKDLKRAEYLGASFDIGEFEPTLAGISSKIPVAIMAGLFRPYIWEARNPVMLLSGLENLIFLGLTFRLLFSLGPFGFFKRVGSSPLLIFSLIFSLFFAFSVGLTTSNFGSLVRYKIPCEPFYLGMLFTLMYLKKEDIADYKAEAESSVAIEEEERDKFKRNRSNTGFIVK
jgi:hypothetical protein